MMLPRSSGELIGSTWIGGCEGSVVLGSTNVRTLAPSAPGRRISAERPGPSGANGPHQMAASTTSPSTLTH